MNKKIRWAILSTCRIAHEFTQRHPIITWRHTHEMFDIIEVCKEQMGVDYEEYEAL